MLNLGDFVSSELSYFYLGESIIDSLFKNGAGLRGDIFLLTSSALISKLALPPFVRFTTVCLIGSFYGLGGAAWI